MDNRKQTDWDRYYRAPAPAAHLLRRITSGRLISALTRTGLIPSQGGSAVELGGGGSSFARRLAKRFRFAEYGVIDTNPCSLALFLDQSLPCQCKAELCSVLGPLPDWKADLVFSAGLIEHFSPGDTARAVRAHFELAKPGSAVAILFPEDTGLYRFVRRILEFLKLWRFPDERPLDPAEVIRAAGCEPCVSEGIRIILLTQRLLIFQHKSEPDERSRT